MMSNRLSTKSNNAEEAMDRLMVVLSRNATREVFAPILRIAVPLGFIAASALIAKLVFGVWI
jgi:hypothetical protein